MKKDISFAILAGGNSKRFGEDKTLALYKGKPLFLYALELARRVATDVMIISKNSSKFQPFLEGVRYLEDDLPEVCPMSGLIKAAQAAKNELVFILPGDMPLFSEEAFSVIYESILDGSGNVAYDAAIPEFDNHKYTLSAIYKREVLLGFMSDYEKKHYKIILGLEKYNLKFVDNLQFINKKIDFNAFLNINYKVELENIQNI